MKRNSAQAPSDFKRLKAKVGKRAPKALNVTETAFQTSSLHVRSQTIDQNQKEATLNQTSSLADLQLISSRGKTLSALLITLNHPSPNVRTSSVQGMQDAIVKASSSETILANLSLLIPALSKCLVDDENSVRNLAISTFRHTFQIVSSSSNGNASNNMRPFLPLHAAYLSSALNSLNESIRLDGVKAADLTFSYFPNAMKEQVPILLPTFNRLLAHLSTSSKGVNSSLLEGSSSNSFGSLDAGTSNKKKKKNKNKGGADSGKDFHRKAVIQLSPKDQNRTLILKSLSSLLNAYTDNNAISTTAHYSDSMDTGASIDQVDPSHVKLLYQILPPPPDLTFQPGGTASNALLYFTNTTTSSQSRLSDVMTYYDFPSVFSHASATTSGTERVVSQTSTKLQPNLSVRTEMLFQLRDCWIEVTQHGEDLGKSGKQNKGGMILNVAYIEQALLIVNTTRYFWNQFCRSFHMTQNDHMYNDENDDNITTTKGRGKKKSSSPKNELQRLKSATKTILNVFMETFPIRDDSSPTFPPPSSSSSNNTNRSKYDLLNASLSSLLAEMGGILALEQTIRNASEGDGSSNNTAVHVESVQQIFDYVLPHLSTTSIENKEEEEEDEEMQKESKGREGAQNRISTSITLLKVVSQLLLPMEKELSSLSEDTLSEEHGTRYYLLNENDRFQLLTCFGQAFFTKDATENENFIQSMVKSMLGRNALQLTVQLIQESLREKILDRRHCIDSSTDMGMNSNETSIMEKHWKELMRMVHFFPTYLQALGGEYPQESAYILHSLICIVRHWRPECERYPANNSNSNKNDSTGESFYDQGEECAKTMDNLIQHLRKEMVQIFTTTKTKQKVGKRTVTVRTSTLEKYPEYVQRLAIGLVGLLSVPSTELMTSLAQICARSTLNDFVADYLFEVLHSIRKNTSVQNYLTFLVNSIGFVNKPVQQKESEGENNEKEESKSNIIMLKETLFRYDGAIARTARGIINCGGYYKILPMLSQILVSWLSLGTQKNVEDVDISKARAALAILGACSLDVSNSFPSRFNNEKVDDVVNEPMNGIWDICGAVVCDFFMAASWEHEDVGMCLQMALSPVVVLLKCHNQMWKNLLQKLSERLCNPSANDVDVQATENRIKALLHLLKSKLLLNVILEAEFIGKGLLKLSRDVESQLRDGPLDRLGGKLRTEVELIVGKI